MVSVWDKKILYQYEVNQYEETMAIEKSQNGGEITNWWNLVRKKWGLLWMHTYAYKGKGREGEGGGGGAKNLT